MDIYKGCKPLFKDFKQNMKLAKKATKDKDFKKSKSYVSDCKKDIEKLEKVINDVKKEGNVDSAGSIIFGYFAAGLLEVCECIVPFSLTLITTGITFGCGVGAGISVMNSFSAQDASSVNEAISKTKGLATIGKATGIISNICAVWLTVKSLIILIKQITEFINQIKKSKDDVNFLNLFFVTYNRYITDLKKQLSAFEKHIDKVEAEYKKSK